MQLRYSSISAANPIAPSALESQSQIATNPSEQPDTLIAALISSEGGNLPPSSVPISEPSEGSPQSPVPQVTEKAKSAPEAEKASVTIEPCKPKTVAGEQIQTPSLQLNEEGVSATKTTAKRAFADPRQCIASMLSQNLDAVTLPAVLTLYKYIQNILGDPAALKFRTINTTNKNFIAKVASSKGSQEFLQSAGFQSSDSHPTMIVYTPPCVVSAGNRSDNGHTATVEELEPLFQAQEALLFALQELNTDPEAAPITKEIVLQRLQQQASASSSRPVISFDPFKASVVRTAPQPVRMESATEKQLQELQLKRRELEGDPQSVQRSTVVSFPSQQPSGQQPMEHSDATYVQQAVDAAGSGTIPGGMLKKIMQSGKEEDSPLTTKAVRDLQRLQKERVYSRTLVHNWLALTVLFVRLLELPAFPTHWVDQGALSRSRDGAGILPPAALDAGCMRMAAGMLHSGRCEKIRTIYLSSADGGGGIAPGTWLQEWLEEQARQCQGERRRRQ